MRATAPCFLTDREGRALVPTASTRTRKLRTEGSSSPSKICTTMAQSMSSWLYRQACTLNFSHSKLKEPRRTCPNREKRTPSSHVGIREPIRKMSYDTTRLSSIISRWTRTIGQTHMGKRMLSAGGRPYSISTASCSQIRVRRTFLSNSTTLI